ncbi:M-phase inducer phosphatase [Nakaseomyces bracarensis]|uniref:M-phase inducer phosphatase n=1 Tax=Nakaseomyces bracarensis TaxID=273131 RepID=A0ABR4NVT1_9SACH
MSKNKETERNSGIFGDDSFSFQNLTKNSPFGYKNNIFKNVQNIFGRKSGHLSTKVKDEEQINVSPYYTDPDATITGDELPGSISEIPNPQDNILSSLDCQDIETSPIMKSKKTFESMVNSVGQENDEFDLCLKLPDLNDCSNDVLLSRSDEKRHKNLDYFPERSRSLQRRNSSLSSSSGRITRSYTGRSDSKLRSDSKMRSDSLRKIHALYELDQNRNYDFQDKKITTVTKRICKSSLEICNISTFQKDNCVSPMFPRITSNSLASLITNKTHEPYYKAYYIIDCRFEYEFQGGHIENAINIYSKERLESEFLQNYKDLPALLIFHCEFSNHRGPNLASHLRNCDRILNHENYPELCFPDIVILDGGYQDFFQKFPELCYPKSYISMNSTENLNNYEEEMNRFRKDRKKFTTRNNSLMKLASMSSNHSLVAEESTDTNIPHDDKSSRKLFYDDLSRPPVMKTSKNSRSISSTSSLLSFGLEPPPKLGLSKYLDANSVNSVGSSDIESTSSRMSTSHSYDSPRINYSSLESGGETESFHSYN